MWAFPRSQAHNAGTSKPKTSASEMSHPRSPDAPDSECHLQRSWWVPATNTDCSWSHATVQRHGAKRTVHKWQLHEFRSFNHTASTVEAAIKCLMVWKGEVWLYLKALQGYLQEARENSKCVTHVSGEVCARLYLQNVTLLGSSPIDTGVEDGNLHIMLCLIITTHSRADIVAMETKQSKPVTERLTDEFIIVQNLKHTS